MNLTVVSGRARLVVFPAFGSVQRGSQKNAHPPLETGALPLLSSLEKLERQHSFSSRSGSASGAFFQAGTEPAVSVRSAGSRVTAAWPASAAVVELRAESTLASVRPLVRSPASLSPLRARSASRLGPGPAESVGSPPHVGEGCSAGASPSPCCSLSLLCSAPACPRCPRSRGRWATAGSSAPPLALELLSVRRLRKFVGSCSQARLLRRPRCGIP